MPPRPRTRSRASTTESSADDRAVSWRTELTRSEAKQSEHVAGGDERVGDRRPIVQRQSRHRPPAQLTDERRADGLAGGVKRGELLERGPILGARNPDHDRFWEWLVRREPAPRGCRGGAEVLLTGASDKEGQSGVHVRSSFD